MKFGVYGCRHYHIEMAVAQLLALGHTCVGVYENEGPLAGKLAAQYRLPRIAEESAFFACQPALVLCAAVNNEKIDVIETCAAHGIPVMLDKPLVTSMADFRRLERVLDPEKIPVGLMLTERFNPPVRALKSLIDAGKLGQLIGFSFSKPHKLTPEQRESWHFDKERNGGPVIDLLVHDIDLLRWLSGSDIREVSGYMRRGDREGYPQLYDDAKLLARMENGVTATLAADWWTPEGYPCFGNGRIVCTGTLGRCEVYTTGEPLIRESEFAVLSTGTIPEKIIAGTVPEKNLIEDFLERVAGRPSLITAGDIRKATWDSLLADRNCTVIPS